MRESILVNSGFLKSIYPALIWAAIVMILCGIPGNEIPELTFLQWMKPDKIVHLIMFGVQNYLLIRAFRKQSRSTGFPFLKNFPFAFATILTILYGILTEVLQATVFIGRTGDYRDAIADAIGALLGILVFNKVTGRKINPA